MAGGRKRKRLSKVSLDNPECAEAPPPIRYRDFIISRIFEGAKMVHVDPDIVAPVRCQGEAGSCMYFAGCDVCSAAYLTYLKETLTQEGKLEEFSPVLLAPQGPLDFGPQNNNLGPNDKPDRFGIFGASDFDIYEYGQDVGFFLDKDLPYQGRRVLRDSKSLPFKRLKYDVKDLDATTLNLPTQIREILKLIRNQPCVATIALTKAFAEHRGFGIFREKCEDEDVGRQAVLVLGYGYEENDELYAIIKNSDI